MQTARKDIQKARDTIKKLRRERDRAKMQAHLAGSHFAGLQAEVADLRRRLGLPTNKRK